MPFADLHKRNNERVQIPPYFRQSNVFLWDLFQGNNFVNFIAPEKHLAVHISKCAEMNKLGSEENEDSEALSKSVRILMFAGPSKDQVMEKSAKQDEKSTRKLHKYNQTVTKSLTLVLENTKGNHFLPGGSIIKADGDNLDDHKTLVNAAVRICKRDLGLDLSSIESWYQVMSFDYTKKDQEPHTTVVMMPDLTEIQPAEDQWAATVEEFTNAGEKECEEAEEKLQNEKREKEEEKKRKEEETKQALKEEAEKKAKEEEEQKKAEQVAEEKANKPDDVGENKDVEKDENDVKTDETQEMETENAEEKPAEETVEPSEPVEENPLLAIADFNKLKVAELKEHLSGANLDIKGKKAELVKRLEDHVASLKAESSAEAEAVPESKDVDQEPVKESKDEEAMETEEIQAETVETVAESEKDEEKVEEKVEPLLSDKQRKEILAKYRVPSAASILAFQGKKSNFVVGSLKNALDRVRSEFSEEKRDLLFESQMTFEIIQETLQHEFSKVIYNGLLRCQAYTKKQKDEAEAKAKAEAEAREAEKAAKEAEEQAAKEKAEAEEKAKAEETPGSPENDMATNEKTEQELEKEEIEKAPSENAASEKADEPMDTAEKDSDEPAAKKAKTRRN